MTCPHCGHDNLPGEDFCGSCSADLLDLDVPLPKDNVQRSLMIDPVSSLSPAVALTIEASALARVPLAVTNKVFGW